MGSFPFSTALVTGASSGIGRELARQLGRGGVQVALVARRREELEVLAEEIKGSNGRAIVLPADLRRPEEAVRIIAEAEQNLSRLDLVIANAGVGSEGPIQEAAWEKMIETMMVNSLAPMAMIRAALPGMLKRKSGYIAGISSLASYRGLPRSGAYSCSKAALSTFLESLRVDIRGQGVSVIDIHPGYIRTPMTSKHKFKMPFLMDVDRAAGLILNAIVRKKPVYSFPWQMALLLRIAHIMPIWLYDSVIAFGNREAQDRLPNLREL